MPRSPFSSSHSTLSPQQALNLATFYLENAPKTKDTDPEVALAMCEDAKAALSRMKKDAKKSLRSSQSVEDQALRDRIAAAYISRSSLLDDWGYTDLAQISYRKAKKWGYIQGTSHLQLPSDSSKLSNGKNTSSISVTHRLRSHSKPIDSQVHDVARVPPSIFSQDVAPAVAKYVLPKTGVRLD
ncbi:hypothetical protein BGZ98_001388, partial [Dissophora globulifera]